MSNVCVATELHRNGLGYALIAKSKLVAQEWGKNLVLVCYMSSTDHDFLFLFFSF